MANRNFIKSGRALISLKLVSEQKKIKVQKATAMVYGGTLGRLRWRTTLFSKASIYDLHHQPRISALYVRTVYRVLPSVHRRSCKLVSRLDTILCPPFRCSTLLSTSLIAKSTNVSRGKNSSTLFVASSFIRLR